MHIHFIGIGGIGVSALAQYYLTKGHSISGSDLVCSEITQALKNRGVKIFIGPHKADNLPEKIDLVIFSPAINAKNPELKKAKEEKIKCQSYPQALGSLTEKYFTIAVSGTHGKSTITAMVGLLLFRARLDPTIILGTKLKEFNNSNCRSGKSKYLVIEADEHFASFLNYRPKIIVLTNIEPDHLDFYKNLKNLIKTFKKYVSLLPEAGFLIANKDDKNVYDAFSQRIKKTLWYSLKDKESQKLRKILKVPGEHNVSNALAALKVGQVLKIPDKVSFKALAKYKGAWRRFEEGEFKIKNSRFKIINDYAHHPTEIRATLKALREKYPHKKICCLFQPHQYQRTYYLFNDFVKVFKKPLVNQIIITDIYDVSGREEKNIKNKINSKKLVKAIKKKKVKFLAKAKILKYLEKNLSDFDILMVMGAGDIYDLINLNQN